MYSQPLYKLFHTLTKTIVKCNNMYVSEYLHKSENMKIIHIFKSSYFFSLIFPLFATCY